MFRIIYLDVTDRKLCNICRSWNLITKWSKLLEIKIEMSESETYGNESIKNFRLCILSDGQS